MNRLTNEKIIKELQSPQQFPAVTIYIPTHRVSSASNVRADNTQFRNLIKQAVVQLVQKNASEDFVKFFKKHCQDLQNDVFFWKHLTESMLIIAYPGTFVVYNLPYEADSFVAVDSMLYLAPIYGMAHELDPIYVLLIRQKNPALLRADLYGMSRVPISLPETITSALRLDEVSTKHVQHHVDSHRQSNTTMYHGHGGTKDKAYSDRMAYMRMIDASVAKQIQSSQKIILAGTISETTEYRTISRLTSILPETIHGTHYSPDDPQLLQESLAILRKYNAQEQRQYVQSFNALASQKSKKASDDMAYIAKASKQGRVESVLLASYVNANKASHIPSNFLPMIHHEIFNRSVQHVIQTVWNQGGRVSNISQDMISSSSRVFALLRY